MGREKTKKTIIVTVGFYNDYDIVVWVQGY